MSVHNVQVEMRRKANLADVAPTADSFDQSAYSTGNRTILAMTAITGSSSAGANGYSSAAEAAAIQTAINALVADVTVLKANLNSLIDDCQAMKISG